ncbi:hypothetical protein F5Y16DRAFT_372868 [Xylariaceae sp. FL0255]|nr:hypothetical protein F5Y16DRAFT_372868 [Xylariaceae sp. FL0255]
MAIGDEASIWPTEDLFLQHGRKHYRTSVSPIHWQLRSLISAEGKSHVYFPAGLYNTHITRLDTTTRECETIKVISFHPRCCVAKGGWICCGGENGEFTIIHESGRDPLSDTLPTDLTSNVAEASMSELHRDMLNIVERLSGTAKSWSASNHNFGQTRVNCITIWLPPKAFGDRPRPGRYASPMAVLANNDKTITIVNLNDAEAIDELEYPDCVNRGVISPDGSLLVAICDDPFLYVHVRCAVLQGKRGSCFEWVPLPRIRLKDQSVRDLSDCRGSFAACFSPSGRYLAVGTQYGTISIFDAAAMVDPEKDPLVTYFSSARAPNDTGAVRDMAFSPGPYDILAWTEHRGRIGVADARSNFTKRQIISIEDHGLYNHLSLNDRNTIDPRLLDPRSEQNAATSSSISGLLSQSVRAQPNTESTDSSRLNHPYSAQETAILEALQSDRRRREAREQREQRDMISARSPATWRTSVYAAERVSPQPRAPALTWEHDRNISERLRYLTTFQRDTLTRLLERERNRENRDHQRSATTQTPPDQGGERRAPTPRRRSSVMQALAQNDNLTQQSIGRVQGSASGDGTNPSRESALAAARADNGWADLEALYSMTGSEGGRETNRIRRAIPVISDVWGDDTTNFRRTYGRIGNRDHQQHADDTAGLAWSEDGRILYIGAEDGIYEFPMNILSRKLFPAVTPR